MTTAQLRALKQDTSEFRTRMQNIIWPFEPKIWIVPKDFAQGIPECDTGDEAKFRSFMQRRGIDQQQARVKIARRRQPLASVAAFTLRLFICDDPETASIAAQRTDHRLVIRRSDMSMVNQTIGMRESRWGEMQQG